MPPRWVCAALFWWLHHLKKETKKKDMGHSLSSMRPGRTPALPPEARVPQKQGNFDDPPLEQVRRKAALLPDGGVHRLFNERPRTAMVLPISTWLVLRGAEASNRLTVPYAKARMAAVVWMGGCGDLRGNSTDCLCLQSAPMSTSTHSTLQWTRSSFLWRCLDR